MITFYDCPVCGQKFSKALNNCPNCGCPSSDIVAREETPKPNIKPVKKSRARSKSKAPVIAIIVVAIVTLAVAAFFIIRKINNDKDDGKKQSGKKAEQSTQTTEDSSADEIEEYKANYKEAFKKMCSGGAMAEDYCNLFKLVWHNSIYKKDDEETDKYTKDEDGNFYDDFNDALTRIWVEEDNYRLYKDIEESQSEVQTIMKSLVNPPEECKEAYDAIKELYDHFIALTNLVTDPGGYNLTNFSSAFIDADKGAANAIEKVKLYID